MKTPEKIYYRTEIVFALCMIATIFFVGKSLNNRTVQTNMNTVSQSSSMLQTESAEKSVETSQIEQNSHVEKQKPKEEHVPISEPPTKTKNNILKYYDVPLSTDIQDAIFTECKTKKVPEDLVIALIGVESHYNSKCISKTNDYGLMQINICHKESLEKDLQVTDLLDSKQNIKAGVHMLAWIVNKYSNVNQALMVYNSGEFGAQKLWKQGIYSTAYSRKVIAQINEIKKLS
nr:transglycosylase SLT domain-containing protein [uncultured Caproiciproducens sp.]